TRGDQIANESVQEGTQCHLDWNTLRRRPDCDHNGQCRLDAPQPERRRKPVDLLMRPDGAQRRETGGSLLRRLEREFRCSSERGREFRNLQQARVVSARAATPCLNEDNRVVARGSVTQIRIYPV